MGTVKDRTEHNEEGLAKESVNLKRKACPFETSTGQDWSRRCSVEHI
jgi:hypothetical protein